MSGVRCSQHHGRPAAWTCTSCGHRLCPLCAAPDPARPGQALCLRCGVAAEPVLVAERPRGLWRTVPRLALSVVEPRGLTMVVVLSVIVVVTSYFPIVGPFIGLGVFAGYFFQVVRSAMGGEPRLPWPTVDNLLDDVVLPAVRFILASLVVVVPLIWWTLRLVRQGPIDPTSADVLRLFGPFIVAALVMPALLIVAAVSHGVFSVLNPLHVIIFVLRVPGAYLSLLLLLLVTGVAEGIVLVVVGLGAGLSGVVWLAPIGGQMVSMGFSLLVALMLGWMIHANREKLGLPAVGREVPAFRDAVPRGRLPVARAPKEGPRADDPRLWPGLPPEPASPAPPAASAAPAPPAASAAPWDPGVPTSSPDAPGAGPLADLDEWDPLDLGLSPPKPTSGPTAAPAPDPLALDPAPTAGGPGPAPWDPLDLSGSPEPSPAPPAPCPAPPATSEPPAGGPQGWLRPPSGDTDSLLADFLHAEPVVPDPDDSFVAAFGRPGVPDPDED